MAVIYQQMQLMQQNRQTPPLPPKRLYRSKNKVMVMVFNATFNDISVISWRSVSLGEKTGIPGENHRPTASD